MWTYQQRLTRTGVKEAFDLVKQDVITYTKINDEEECGYEIHVERKGEELKSGNEHYVYKPYPVIKEASEPYTLAKITEFYNAANAEWLNSETLGKYQNFFDEEEPGLKEKINLIVVLALGDFSDSQKETRFKDIGGESGYPYRQKKYLYQLAWIESLCAHLPNVTPEQVFFQDPAFTEVDKEFLARKGYTIGNVPYTYNHMSETTLLINLDAHSAAMHAFEIQRPAMYIGKPLFTRQTWKVKTGTTVVDKDPPHKWFTENLFSFGEKKLEKIMPNDSIQLEDHFFKDRGEAESCSIMSFPRLYENLHYLKPEDNGT